MSSHQPAELSHCRVCWCQVDVGICSWCGSLFFFRSPATAPETELDAWWMTSPLGTPRGRYDEYSNSFSLSKKPRFNVDQEKSRQWQLKVMRTGLVTLQQGRRLTILVDSSSASSNAEPAHTQTSTLLPTCDEVVNLTGLLETKVMSVSSGKQ